jgi:hypothetical protein
VISAIERCKYLSLEFIVGSSFSTTGRKEGGGKKILKDNVAWISLLIGFPSSIHCHQSVGVQILYYEGSSVMTTPSFTFSYHVGARFE